jgi:hypothetical protein
MWCCQEADEEGQAHGGSHRGLCWGVNLSPLQLVGHRPDRSPVHQGLNMDEEVVQKDCNPRRVRGTYRAQVRDSSWPGALPRGGQAEAQTGWADWLRQSRSGGHPGGGHL